jgi:hypothetical protein
MKEVAVCALAFLATGSFAQTAASAKFYVVRDPAKKCACLKFKARLSVNENEEASVL